MSTKILWLSQFLKVIQISKNDMGDVIVTVAYDGSLNQMNISVS
jgi:hypothetical protein